MGQERHLHPVYGILKDGGSCCIKLWEEKKSEGAEQARAGRGWWAVGLVEARWRLPRLPARWTGKGGGPPWGWNRSSSNLLPPKLDPLQFYWAWPDQARPWLLDFSVFYRTSILPSRLESFATLTLTPLIHALTHHIKCICILYWHPPLSFTFTHFHPFSPFSSTFTYFQPFSSIFIKFSTIFVNFHLPSSILIHIHSFSHIWERILASVTLVKSSLCIISLQSQYHTSQIDRLVSVNSRKIDGKTGNVKRN